MLVGWLVGWLCFTSHRQRGHLATATRLLSLAKDLKLGFYTVPTGNRTPGRRVAVHYTTAAPRHASSYYRYNHSVTFTIWRPVAFADLASILVALPSIFTMHIARHWCARNCGSQNTISIDESGHQLQILKMSTLQIFTIHLCTKFTLNMG